MNSLRSLQRALAYEVERQTGLLAAGDDGRAGDPPLGRGGGVHPGRAQQGGVQRLPLLPRARPGAGDPGRRPARAPASRPARTAGAAAGPLPGAGARGRRRPGRGGEEGYGALLDAAAAAGADPRVAANWLTGEVTAHLRRLGLGAGRHPADRGPPGGTARPGGRGAACRRLPPRRCSPGCSRGRGPPSRWPPGRDLIQISDEARARRGRGRRAGRPPRRGGAPAGRGPAAHRLPGRQGDAGHRGQGRPAAGERGRSGGRQGEPSGAAARA